MKFQIGILWALVAFFAFTAHAQNDAKVTYEKEIQRAINLGSAILELDNSAWAATDSLIANEEFFEANKTQLRGWITLPNTNKQRTIFVGETENGTQAFAEFETVGRKTVLSKFLGSPRELTKTEAIFWQVKQTTTAQLDSVCSDFPDINVIVMPVPNEKAGRFYGYTFSSSKKWEELVLGKHFRHLISADGISVISSKSFSNTCFAISTQQVPEDAEPVAAFATYLKAPYPEEHHVFASLSRNVPLFIGTANNNRFWHINGGNITEVKVETD